MKRLTLAAFAIAASAALAGCEEPRSEREEYVIPEAPAPVAPSAEDQAAPASETAAPETTPQDYSTLPPEERPSEETVKPESETLFY